MIEKELEEKYEKLYQKLDRIHYEINSWALKLDRIAGKIYGNQKFEGMYELGVLYQKIRQSQEEIQENWLEEDEEDGQED